MDPALRGPFIHWLTAAARTPRLRIVITLRADVYAHCVQWQALAELLRTGSYPLAAPPPRGPLRDGHRPRRTGGVELRGG